MKNITIGCNCSYNEIQATIQKFVDFKSVIIREDYSGDLHIVQISELEFEGKVQVDQAYIDSINDFDWMEANRRYSIIKPLIEIEKGDKIKVNKTVFVQELAETHEVGYATIYRWLSVFNTTGLVSSLVRGKPPGGKGESRLNEETDLIIQDTIESFYQTSQRRTKKQVATEVIRKCKNAGVDSPHPNTVLNRIREIDSQKKLTKRIGYLDVDQKVDATPGTYDEAKNPLDIVQIDHTVLDIIVVSEKEREPIGRPYITLAIDVYSRMVAGVYISLDPPGALGTGICLSNAILPKDEIQEKYDIQTEWPLWGVMRNIHMDNAKEFKGNMLLDASKEYGFTINWRPKGKSRYGAHVERLLGSFSKQIHSLPGTTFEDVKYRSNYNSETEATMTMDELEKWLHIQIADVYHNKIHSGIGSSPLKRFNDGVFGTGTKEGIGVPLMQLNPDKVRLDFLPQIERTIQRFGVTIDHINYYSDIFRSYLFDQAWKNNDRFVRSNVSRKYTFKRDPRDISKIYFLNEKEGRYAEIPYADLRRPAMSIWEHRASLKIATEQNRNTPITEDIIFQAYNRLREIEENSKTNKKKAKRVERKRKVQEFKKSVHLKNSSPKTSVPDVIESITPITIKPFDFDEEL